MRTFWKNAVTVLLCAVLTPMVLAGCSSTPSYAKTDVKDFYLDFVKTATSLPPQEVRKAYTDIINSNKDSNENSYELRQAAVERITQLNPDLFNKIWQAPDKSNFDNVTSMFSAILLFSMNMNQVPVAVDVDESGISDWQNTKGYSFPIATIDRKKIFASLDEKQSFAVKPYHRDALSLPVTIGVVDGQMKIVPDSQPLWELGEPNKNV